MPVRSRSSRHALTALVGSLLVALAIVVVTPLRSAPWLGFAEVAARVGFPAGTAPSHAPTRSSRSPRAAPEVMAQPDRIARLVGSKPAMRRLARTAPRAPVAPRYLLYRALLR
ncbi:MAG TPA: hypothetical protein PLU22_03145 [Polyangiaceae bacterium]|nr:hypothetical protein [Polyangiaceae bacterium]